MSRPQFLPLKLHGLVLDLRPEDVPADRWSNGRNVFFKNGDTFRCEGINATLGTELFPVDICWYVDTGVQEWWYYASGAGIGLTDGSNHYNVTPTTGWGAISTKNFVLSAGDLNSLPWISHPEKGPFWHDGDPSHKFVKLPGWPTGWSCRVMRAHKNFLMALNVNTGTVLLENQVSWSSSADPGKVPDFWTPAATNDAGDATFGSPSGPIVSGISLRDQFFVMKQNATFSMSYVGGQFVFQARDVFPSMGIYGPNAAIENDNMIYMLTGGSEFIRHDGNSVQNLLYGVAQDYLGRVINAEWPSSPFCYLTDNECVVAIAYPTTVTAACTEALGIEIASIGRDGPIDVGMRDLPNVSYADRGITQAVGRSWDIDTATWASDATQWNELASGFRPPQTVFAGGAAGMLQLGLGADVLGVPIDAYAERLTMDMGDFSTHKILSGAFPRVAGNAGDSVYWRFGGQNQVGDSVNWGAELTQVIGTTQQLDFFQDARLAALSVRSHGGSAWQSNGVEVLARKGGRW